MLPPLLKRIAKKVLGIKDKLAPFYTVGSNTRFYAPNALEVRNKEISRTVLAIGSDSVIEGKFIFEKETGTITVGDRTYIGASSYFICTDHISIGNDVMFSWGCTVMDNNAHSLTWEHRQHDVRDWKRGLDDGNIGKYKNWEHVRSAPIVIKDKAWIGFNVIIMKGVEIGEGAVVGSGSVVTKSVPDFAVVAGNPAQIIKYTK